MADIERNDEDDEGVVVPESALLRPMRPNKYGSIEGLDDEELADPDELERVAMMEMWAPILALPWEQRRSDIRPTIDESGHVDWGAFGTVDFERHSGSFDKARYKAEKLRERLRDKLIMLSIVGHRLPGNAKKLVLKYLRLGIIDLDDIVNEDMRALAKLYLQARQKQAEIARFYEERKRRQEREGERLMARLA